MLHFYSGQVRRFLTQFMRILNNFSVETGRGKDDQIALRPVPVVYGDATRQVANIIRNNSENALFFHIGGPFWQPLGGSWVSLVRLWASKIVPKSFTIIDGRRVAVLSLW